MPEHIRALIFILLLAGTLFMLAKKPCGALVGDQTFKRWRLTWFALTLAAFLAHNFWLYALIAVLVLSFAARQEPNRTALFFLTLFLLPAAAVEIPGLGIINHLIAVDHILLLELVILLPAYFQLQMRGDTLSFGRIAADKFLAAYLLLMAALLFRETTATGWLRDIFYLFANTFLPYFVISRSIKSLPDFRGALTAFALAAAVLAAVGIFENARHWLLYKAVEDALGIHWGYTGYLGRADMLRAQASAGQAIAYGYLMAVGLGVMLYIKNLLPEKTAARLGLALMAGGLAASLSRGPWVGAAVLVAAFTALGPQPARRLATLLAAALLLLAAAAILPGGQKAIDLLPWIGTVEKGGVEYRERVFEGSLVTIDRNPLFGTTDFTKYPEMQDLIQGQGIIDIVNTYLLIALKYGLVVLFLFVAFFGAIVWDVFRQMRRQPPDSEARLLGRTLLACLIGILAIISTVSNITVISVVYWSFAGLGVAYARLAREAKTAT